MPRRGEFKVSVTKDYLVFVGSESVPLRLTLLIDPRRCARCGWLQHRLRPMPSEDGVEATLDFRPAHVERRLICLCRRSTCTARQYDVRPRLPKLRLKALVNRLERGRNVVAAKEFRNCAHRLMSEDAPCRGLDEGIEIVTKVYLYDLGARVLQPPNHLAEAGLDFRVHQIQELGRREGQSGSLQVVAAIGELRSLFTSHDLIQQNAVLDASGESTGRVERMRDRSNAVARPTSGGWANNPCHGQGPDPYRVD